MTFFYLLQFSCYTFKIKTHCLRHTLQFSLMIPIYLLTVLVLLIVRNTTGNHSISQHNTCYGLSSQRTNFSLRAKPEAVHIYSLRKPANSSRPLYLECLCFYLMLYQSLTSTAALKEKPVINKETLDRSIRYNIQLQMSSGWQVHIRQREQSKTE